MQFAQCQRSGNRSHELARNRGAVLAVALAAAVLLALPRRAVSGRLAATAATAGLIAVLLGPTAFTVATIDAPIAGGDPSAGPEAASARGPGLSAGADDGSAAVADGLPGSGALPDRPTGAPGAAGPGSLGADAVDEALVDYLVANRGDATWVVAATSAMSAGSIQLATGLPVMAMGRFSGNDPAPTLDQLKEAIGSGALRFVLVGRGGARAPGGFGVQPPGVCKADIFENI